MSLLLAAGCSTALADPFMQQGPKLTPEGELGSGGFGDSVALSANGATAVIGAPGDDELRGAAWVFARSGSSWTQLAELTGGEQQLGGSPDGVAFGDSVAISADGSTVLVGGFGDDTDSGAAWVFVSDAGGAWQQQGPKLLGGEEVGRGEFGRSVALSADGGTALVGGDGDSKGAGAAWVLTRSEGVWTQQGEKLTGAGETGRGRFGDSVALSADGATALIGAGSDHPQQDTGAAWAFAREGTGWVQQGEKLTGAGETDGGRFGASVALSGDGQTALVGGPGDEETAGAAWVFAREGASWLQQGEKLTSTEPTEFERFGDEVALSGDGNRALIGAYGAEAEVGAAWMLAREGSSWEQPGEKLTGGEEAAQAAFGLGVALSGNGHNALIGGPDDGAGCCAGPGAAWAFSDGFIEPPPEEIAPGGSEPGLFGGPGSGAGNPGGSPGGPSVKPRPTAKNGLGTASSSSARLARLFVPALKPSGKHAKIGALLAHGGLVASLRAFAPGKAAIYWYKTVRALAGAGAAPVAEPKTRSVLVAAGKVYFKAAGKAGVDVRLTRAGKKLLRRSKRVQLTAKGTFTPNGAGAVVATRAFTLVR
ncbi:MAG TPA: hypothetical protein VHW67_08560 [Solirubrobacteraceae bacterium]|nr:hypothetical protein [Solirubrobacteraceae bacterium]